MTCPIIVANFKMCHALSTRTIPSYLILSRYNKEIAISDPYMAQKNSLGLALKKLDTSV